MWMTKKVTASVVLCETVARRNEEEERHRGVEDDAEEQRETASGVEGVEPFGCLHVLLHLDLF